MNEITVKGVKPESFAFNDKEYDKLKKKQDAAIARGEEVYTIYQVGRIVESPLRLLSSWHLHSAPLKDALWCLGYGSIILAVQHVDKNGVPIPINKLMPGRQEGGYISQYQKVIKAFDFRTVKGVDDFFAFAAEHGVTPKEMSNSCMAKARIEELGKEAYAELYRCLEEPIPLTSEEILEEILSGSQLHETNSEPQEEEHHGLWSRIKAMFGYSNI